LDRFLRVFLSFSFQSYRRQQALKRLEREKEKSRTNKHKAQRRATDEKRKFTGKPQPHRTDKPQGQNAFNQQIRALSADASFKQKAATSLLLNEGKSRHKRKIGEVDHRSSEEIKQNGKKVFQKYKNLTSFVKVFNHYYTCILVFVVFSYVTLHVLLSSMDNAQHARIRSIPVAVASIVARACLHLHRSRRAPAARSQTQCEMSSAKSATTLCSLRRKFAANKPLLLQK